VLEAQGLRVSLAGAQDKPAPLNAESVRQPSVVSLGMPTSGQLAVRTEEVNAPAPAAGWYRDGACCDEASAVRAVASSCVVADAGPVLSAAPPAGPGQDVVDAAADRPGEDRCRTRLRRWNA
jgi:hypothetical protein